VDLALIKWAFNFVSVCANCISGQQLCLFRRYYVSGTLESHFGHFNFFNIKGNIRRTTLYCWTYAPTWFPPLDQMWMAQVSGGNRPILMATFLLELNLIGLNHPKRDLENSHLPHGSLRLNPRDMIGFVHILTNILSCTWHFIFNIIVLHLRMPLYVLPSFFDIIHMIVLYSIEPTP
jgi:hypothetical protein